MSHDESNGDPDLGRSGYSSPVVSHSLMSEVAFQLLASSEIRRYMREARRLTAESSLPGELQASAEARARAQARLAHLLERIDREAVRTPEEFEAVILLCALVPIDPDGTRKLLRRACTSSSPWVRSAAVHMASPPAPRAQGLGTVASTGTGTGASTATGALARAA